MAFKATVAQQTAIDERGNILVSAAAGSGKTAVLVERVISRITDKVNPISADRLLIVTFTNAAAAEMRTRIEKRLDEECRLNPDDIGLLRQKHLIASSKICTIDSFCIDLVRENFERAGVNPDFKVSDEGLLRSVNEKIAGEIFEEYLERGNKDFFSLLDIAGADYDEGKFINALLDIYRYSRNMAEPEAWFDKIAECYFAEFNSSHECYKYAFNKAERIISDILSGIVRLKNYISLTDDAANVYLPYLSLLIEKFEELKIQAEKNDWDEFYESLQGFSVPSLPSSRKISGLEEVDACKQAAASYKDDLEVLRKLFFARTDFIRQTNNYLSAPIRLFADILKELDKRIFEEYLRINTFTFHNTEHLALKLLEEFEELSASYDEVMVDEYQDVNDLQDRLFYILSGKEKNLFVVGDVKQSIYGFRGANPDNFISKKDRYIPVAEAKDNQPKKIVLGNNFRSRKGVCDFVNFFFENTMSRENGGIDYNFEEALIPSAVFPENSEKCAELHIITNGENSETAVKYEAGYIADYIKRKMAEEPFIKEGDALRKAKFSDFAILLRSTSKKAPVMAEKLRKHGVPVNYSSEGYAEAIEISVFLSLLKIIDNPMSNIELLCVMLSPIFGFTPDETARIRAAYRHGELYSAVVYAAENGNEKANGVLKRIEKYRRMAVTLALPELITKLLYETGYLKIVYAMSDGERRRNNLLLLSKYAEEFSSGEQAGIGRFVDYIKRQSERGLKSAAALSGENSVKIMSIHGSKGLQFPVCIVADTATAFNDSDSKESIVYSGELGLGLKYFDDKVKEKVTTAIRQTQIEEMKAKELSEELRLLYVAMTRAEEKLVFVASPKKYESNILKAKTNLIAAGSNGKVCFTKGKSYFDWILTALLLHPDCHNLRGNASKLIPLDTESVVEVNEEFYVNEPYQDYSENLAECSVDTEIVEKIKENINFVYPYAKYRETQSKASVSVIANKAESEHFAFTAKPSFMCGGVTATQIGNATHKVMQFYDFEKSDDNESELDRLVEWQFITEREAECVSKEALKTFFESDIFKRIKKSDTVKREMRFLTEMPASRINPELEGEKEENIIVQGAVDLCFVENGELVILDFKTDRVTDMQQLKSAYSEQLNIYSAACEKIFSKKVKEKILYSFRLGKEISF